MVQDDGTKPVSERLMNNVRHNNDAMAAVAMGAEVCAYNERRRCGRRNGRG